MRPAEPGDSRYGNAFSYMTDEKLPFHSHLWKLASPIWEAISAHPFLSELQAGTLPLESFRYYVVQDYLYLAGFGRAAAAGLSMARDTDTARRLLRRVSTPVERPLHVGLFEALGVSEDEAENAIPSPTNLAYMNHIEVSMDVDGLACGVAALLPCPRIYHEVGKILSAPDHPIYKMWQSTYSEGLLEASVAGWSELLDELALESGPLTRRKMESAYLTSARYEYMFWSMGYNRESWPA